jgi:hypothetical protein
MSSGLLRCVNLVEVYRRFRGSKYLWIVGKLLLVYKVQQPRRPSGQFISITNWKFNTWYSLFNLGMYCIGLRRPTTKSPQQMSHVSEKTLLHSWCFMDRYSCHRLEFTLASLQYWLIWIREKNKMWRQRLLHRGPVTETCALPCSLRRCNQHRQVTILNSRRSNEQINQELVSQLFI